MLGSSSACLECIVACSGCECMWVESQTQRQIYASGCIFSCSAHNSHRRTQHSTTSTGRMTSLITSGSRLAKMRHEVCKPNNFTRLCERVPPKKPQRATPCQNPINGLRFAKHTYVCAKLAPERLRSPTRPMSVHNASKGHDGRTVPFKDQSTCQGVEQADSAPP